MLLALPATWTVTGKSVVFTGCGTASLTCSSALRRSGCTPKLASPTRTCTRLGSQPKPRPQMLCTPNAPTSRCGPATVEIVVAAPIWTSSGAAS